MPFSGTSVSYAKFALCLYLNPSKGCTPFKEGERKGDEEININYFF